MIMPGLRDPKANEELFYCGTSAFNACDICEACPGGTRLECEDPTHDCFAGVTGCPDASAMDADISIDYIDSNIINNTAEAAMQFMLLSYNNGSSKSNATNNSSIVSSTSSNSSNYTNTKSNSIEGEASDSNDDNENGNYESNLLTLVHP